MTRLGQVAVGEHGGDHPAHVVEGAGDATTRHTDPAVLGHRDGVARVGEGLGLRLGVGAVVGRAPEAAVHDEDGRVHRGRAG